MKIIKRMLTIVLAALCLAGSTSCSSKTRLAAPDGLIVNEDNAAAILEWNAVPNATYYKVNINGKDVGSSITRTKYSLASLGEGEYDFKVRAFDTTGNYRESDWSADVHYTKQKESGLKFTLTNATTEYSVTGIGSAKGNIVIPDNYRGKPVTTIAAKVFYTQAGVKSVTLGKNIKSVGKLAFASCSNLETVIFSNEITSITLGTSIFQSCSDLSTVQLPDCLTAIPDNAFSYCKKLTDIKIGANVVSIGKEAFSQCPISKITFPDSVTTLGESAFGYCDKLVFVNTGNGLTEIPDSAFHHCNALENITIGSSVKKIGSYTFQSCTSLKSVAIPDSVEEIAEAAFSECTALTDVSVGLGVKSIGKNAFAKTKLYDVADNGVYYAGKWAIDSVANVDEVQNNGGDLILRDDTVGIANSAFYGTKITVLIVPDSVLYIGMGSFRKCTELTAIDLGKGVKTLGESAFRECEKLGRGKVGFGTSLETIGKYAFAGCKDLGNPQYTKYSPIKLPKTVMKIGQYAFYQTDYWTRSTDPAIYIPAEMQYRQNNVKENYWFVGYKKTEDTTSKTLAVKEGTIGISEYACYKKTVITSITIPESVKMIGIGAFSQCSALMNVFIDQFSPITEIPDYAFYKCSALMEVQVPSTVTKIGRSAFYKSGIMAANVSQFVETIGDYAFFGCSNLVEVNFGTDTGKSVLTTIGQYAFANNTALPRITLPDTVVSIGKSAFSKNTALTTVVFSSALTEIGESAFYTCTSLKQIQIPDGVKEIKKKTFYKCENLTYAVLNSVEKIGDYAFSYCNSLKSIEFPETLREIGSYAFSRCSFNNIFITDNIEVLGAHAFSGNMSTMIFVEAEEIPETWSARWNSSYRPVITGCKFNKELGEYYVVSFTKTADGVKNIKAIQSQTVAEPTRKGYSFAGWSAISEESGSAIIYKTEELDTVKNGTVLTAVWIKDGED